MTAFRRLPSLLLFVSLATLSLHAADKSQAIADRLKAAATRSSLDTLGLQPWHLKAELTLFDVDGKNPTPATVELWATDNNMKMIESVGSLQITTIRNGDRLFRTTGTPPQLAEIELLVEQIIHPIPDEFLQSGVKMTEDKTSVAKIPVDCIVPSLPAPQTDVISIGRQLSFCLKRDTDSLLISYAPGEIANLRQQIGTFQSKEVPVAFKFLSAKAVRSDVKLTKLETFTPAFGDFTPTPEMSLFTGPVEAAPTDLIDSILSKTPPSYPPSAKARGVGGSVKFDAVIGPDGRIVSLQPTTQMNPDLIAAAQDAVRHWIYRPFFICGVPVQVKTVITINFNLGG
jgi:hypothetical protein